MHHDFSQKSVHMKLGWFPYVSWHSNQPVKPHGNKTQPANNTFSIEWLLTYVIFQQSGFLKWITNRYWNWCNSVFNISLFHQSPPPRRSILRPLLRKPDANRKKCHHLFALRSLPDLELCANRWWSKTTLEPHRTPVDCFAAMCHVVCLSSVLFRETRIFTWTFIDLHVGTCRWLLSAFVL